MTFPLPNARASSIRLTAAAALLFWLAACAPAGRSTTTGRSTTGSSTAQSSSASGIGEGLPSGCESKGSFSCAEPVAVGARPASGVFEGSSALDPEFYEVSMDSPGVLEIAIAPMPPSAGARVIAYDRQQEQVAFLNVRERGKSLFLDVPVRAETYYLEVHGFVNDPTPYEMQLALDTEDPYEYNGTLAEAKGISVSQTIRAKAKPSGDDDFYKFEVGEAGRFELTIESVPATQRMEAEIYGTRQESMGIERTREAGANLYGEFEANRSGTHYLRVQGEGRSDDLHEITIRPVDSGGSGE